jgi:tetratricopeptide (TPR) repeat protein
LRSGVGDPAGASVHAEQGAKLAEKVKDPKLAGEAWMVLGDLRFDSDASLAREAYAKALASWGNDLALLARRANVTYNLAALEAHEGEIAAAQERFSVARDLALRAGDAGLVARVDEILLRLESE